MEDKLVQLRMRLDSKIARNGLIMPSGYELRVASAADEGPLTLLLNEAYPGRWDAATTLEKLIQNPNVPKTFVIWHHQRIVATASYLQLYEDFPRTGWVHYVGASPEHRGKGLGRLVTLAVVEASWADGDELIKLNTDDERLPAIATYLRLGFEPDCWHDTHESRWAAVMKALDADRRKPN